MRLLFELGLEELPSRYVVTSENALKKNVEKRLIQNRINFEKIESFSTARRLSILIDGLSSKQEDLNEEKIGPSYQVAIKDGKATKALLGFLASNDLKEDEYEIVDTEKGKYVKIRKYSKGVETIELITKILDESIKELEFEKTMKWGSNSFRFVRPIKWIVLMVDDKVLDFTFEGIKASNITRGMRVFGSQEIVLDKISEYEQKLLENFVIARRDLREKMTLESIEKNCNSSDRKVEIDKELLEEVVNLVEYPYAIMGEFDASYLNLPEELITITMKTHQRYFPVRFLDGKLANNFVVIRNAPEYSELVKKGNEKVIEPRLADSKFFFDEDLKVNLVDNVEKLKLITFQKDMGTIYEKVERSIEIAKYLNANEDTLRTILLSKADLVSNVINEKEFTGLQGMMGGIYAKNSNENDIVSKAIPEHYMPRFQGDTIATTIEGAIAGISDKLDTAIGAFCVGLKPTGSKDPYAIRRASLGICLTAIDKKLDVDYTKLIEKAYEIFSSSKKVLYPKAKEEFVIYFRQRLENVLSEKYSKNLVSYVINQEFNFKKLVEKLEKLKTFENTERFESLINLLKRMKNIVKENKDLSIDETLVTLSYEKDMYNLIKELNGKDFSEKIDILLNSENSINSFFDNVKINTEDENLTKNRIAILNNILHEIGEIIEI